MNFGEWNFEIPIAVGLVRTDVSGPDYQRHAEMILQHAARSGYRYMYTAHPGKDDPDPIGYALGLASGFDAAALVIYDLATVDHTPSRVCELFDLETVIPPETWAASMPTIADQAHAHPEKTPTVLAAQRAMQQHIKCSTLECATKASAYSALVRAGKIVPPADTQRDRAAARGIRFRPRTNDEIRLSDGATVRTSLDALGGLANIRTHDYATRRHLNLGTAGLAPGTNIKTK
ncbi:hypothetical protein ACWDSJ_01315 [Nocardia sp. NPDC003482]